MIKERVTISLEKTVLKQLDECAKSLNMNRSQFVEWMLTNSLPIINPVVNKVSKVMESAFNVIKDLEKEKEK